MSTVPKSPQQPVEPPPRPSATQVVASVLTAVTTTFAMSYLGVAGTIIGAGIASTFTVLANYLYTRSIMHTHRKVTQIAPRMARSRPIPRADETQPLPEQDSRRGAELMAPARAGRRRFVVPIVVVFVLLLLTVTLVELGIGKPISDALRGNDSSGTTVFHRRTAPTPGGIKTPGGTQTQEPTPTQTGDGDHHLDEPTPTDPPTTEPVDPNDGVVPPPPEPTPNPSPPPPDPLVPEPGEEDNAATEDHVPGTQPGEAEVEPTPNPA